MSLSKVISTTGIRALGAVCVFATTILVARELTIAASATFFFGQSLTVLVSVLARLGLDRAFTKLGTSIGKNAGISRISVKRGRAKLFTLLLSSVIFSAFTVIVIFALKDVGFIRDHSTSILLLFAAAIPFSSAYGLCGALLLGLRRPFLGTLVSSTLPAGITFLIVSGAAFSPDSIKFPLVFFSYFFGAAVAGIFGLYIVLVLLAEVERCEETATANQQNRRAEKDWTNSFGGFSMIGFSNALEQWYPTFILGVLAPAQHVAIYAVANRFISAVQLVLISTNNVYAPDYANVQDIGVLKKITNKAGWHIILLGISLIMAMALGNQWLLGIFGDKFLMASHILIILLAGQLFNLLSGPSATILVMRNRVRPVAMIFLGASVALIVGGAVAAKFDSSSGVASVAALCIVAQSLAIIIRFNKEFGYVAIPKLPFGLKHES